MPSRSATPGRKPSTTTSARLQSARASSGSRFRSQTTDSLPAFSRACHCGATCRSASPSGDSSRTTRAPSPSSSRVANGPGRSRVRSTTRSPCSCCTFAKLRTRLDSLTDRSTAAEEKRRLIRDAAVRVFARKGYHASRVGDIAEEAGVAHGLLYHYFSSKEELLETVFRDTWSELLEAFARVEESGEAASEQLRQVAAILLRSWRHDPDLVRVLVREIGRSQTLPDRVDEISAVFRAIERIVERGQAAGELRDDVTPRIATWIFYGGIEEILTGWVLGQLDDGEDDVAAAERAVVGVVVGGLSRAAAPAPAAG